MDVKLKLVKEKKVFLNHFTYSKIFGTYLLFIAIPTFFVLPFLDKGDMYWFWPYFKGLFLLFILSWMVMVLKYFFSYDYDCIGTLILSDDKIFLVIENEEKEIDLKTNRIKLYYNGVRRIGFHYCRDLPRSGIFELNLNDVEKVYSIINNYSELEQVKNRLKTWYKQKFYIEEFTRTKEKNRLFELEIKFDWARLNEFKRDTEYPNEE